MKDRLHQIRQKGAQCRQNMPRWFIVFTLALSLVVAPAAAQTIEQSWTADFEDGTQDGWTGENTEVSSESIEGDYSLTQPDNVPFTERAAYTEGPVIDLSQQFEINGTIRAEQGDDSSRVRFGLINDNDNGAMIILSGEYNATFLGETGGESPSGQDTISGDFDNTWVNFKIESPEDSDTLRAKVWPYGTEEPSDWQLERTYTTDVSAPFSVVTGNTEHNRRMWIDSVGITGTEATSPKLSIDAENYMKHGTSQEYRVLWEENTTGIANETTDVTDNATATSLNTSVITVDNSTNELVATNDTDVNQRVSIRAEYNDSVTYKEITVATSDVENLEVLPPLWRFSASIGSPTIQAILVAVFFGVFAGRLAGAFAGLGMMELVMVAGWFIGYVSVGMAMISLFTALFIGLNMAANIDYQVTRR